MTVSGGRAWLHPLENNTTKRPEALVQWLVDLI